MPEVIEAMVLAAKAGDVSAAKVLIVKVIPSLRPVNPPSSSESGVDSLIRIAWRD